jgi:hypothetical protein
LRKVPFAKRRRPPRPRVGEDPAPVVEVEVVPRARTGGHVEVGVTVVVDVPRDHAVGERGHPEPRRLGPRLEGPVAPVAVEDVDIVEPREHEIGPPIAVEIGGGDPAREERRPGQARRQRRGGLGVNDPGRLGDINE